MSVLGTSPFVWLRFDENGSIGAGAAVALSALLDCPGIGDLVVLSHGWKNDEADARRLYGGLWANACAALPPGRAERTVVAGVLWPAKEYRTDFDAEPPSDAGAGIALSTAGCAVVSDMPAQEFDLLVDGFEAFLCGRGVQAAAAARGAATKPTPNSSFAFVRSGAAAVGMDAGSPDVELARDSRPLGNALDQASDAHFLLERLRSAPRVRPATQTGGAPLGLAAPLQSAYEGTRAAVARFLNQLTYFEMKRRAGLVGGGLAADVLGRLTPARAIRLHLVGHSFGARLVTAAAQMLTPRGHVEFRSLTLLQGAFSHNALTKAAGAGIAGAFPDVVGKPSGPISITHTHNDLACTVAYALASRLSRDTTSSIGDAQDEYGAMGANGPQKLTAGVAEPDDAVQAFEPRAGKVNTFLADAFIIKTDAVDAHNNVATPACGRLLASTIKE